MNNLKAEKVQKASFNNEDIERAMEEIEEWHVRRNSAFGFALIATGLAVLSIGEGLQVFIGCAGAFIVPYFLDNAVKSYYPVKQNELMEKANGSEGSNEKTVEEAKKAIEIIKDDGYKWVKSSPTVIGLLFSNISIAYKLSVQISVMC